MKKKLKPILLLAFLAVAGGAHAQTDTIRQSAGAASKSLSAKATNKDLAGSLAGATDFSTLQSALTASGLADKAKEQGPYTVFAPSNDAFAKLPTGTLETLTAPASKDKLAAILANHVVSGSFSAADLKDGQTLKTVGGGTLTVRKQGNSVMLTDAKGGSAMVTTADIQATNGMVHAVDSVLMPK
ncbi:fasciclin domain-containing protein [Fibrella sp. HMF5335]|uniref:Fasciclin domain-containing protein n=1 Tax=Fibrella rubiginis TaxID=2817060 RepID=A0A939GI73_9BACT|nr:fasciclin domain-containing protein [Fibrella rubiginis]MBO0939529.1 fasciclin domain-containing protein [Fibrella rubiginis]